jgi:hypothetical protein
LIINDIKDFGFPRLLLDGDNFLENENEMFHGLPFYAERASELYARVSGKGQAQLFPKTETLSGIFSTFAAALGVRFVAAMSGTSDRPQKF